LDRQRGARPLVVAAIVLGVLASGTACQANNSAEAVQTAVAAAQTVLPAGQTAAAGAQTVLPAAQATAQAGATLVSDALNTAQPVIQMLQGLLQGASVNVSTVPDGAAPSAVTAVTVEGTDSQGRLEQVDEQTRHTLASATLSAISQYYPQANVTLTVVDDAGNMLVSGSTAPGRDPAVQ
jgi:hypothetical protein